MSKIVDRIFNTVLTTDDSSQEEELGGFRFDSGKIYKYVEFTDSISAIAGGPVILDGTTPNVVSCDLNAGASDTVCGVSLTAVGVGHYGWIQIYGVATVKISDELSCGHHLIAATTDNFWTVAVQADTTDSTGYKSGAVALQDYKTATDATISAFIRCM